MSANFRRLLGLTVVLTCTAWGQQRFGGYVTFNKILVAFAPIASSGNGEQIVQSRTYVGKDAIHRVIFNSDGSLYFGYDFVVEPLANSKFLVTMKPLSAEGLQSFLTGNNTAVQGSGAGGGVRGGVIGGAQAEAKTQTSVGTGVQGSGAGGGVRGIGVKLRILSAVSPPPSAPCFLRASPTWFDVTAAAVSSNF